MNLYFFSNNNVGSFIVTPRTKLIFIACIRKQFGRVGLVKPGFASYTRSHFRLLLCHQKIKYVQLFLSYSNFIEVMHTKQ